VSLEAVAPDAYVGRQRDAPQTCPLAQIVVHPPQCARLVVVSTHVLPHGVAAPSHTQPPETQDAPVGHTRSQRPQWSLSLSSA
jgi:hypothetical protein